MSEVTTPFDHTFVEAVESVIFPSHYNWRYLFTHSDISSCGLAEDFRNLGYTTEFIQERLTAINMMPPEILINIALSDDVVKKAAIGSLQVKTSRVLFEKAKNMLHSTSAAERELGLCLLTYKLGEAFLAELEPVLYEICKIEKDDSVLEALCYAMYHLCIDERETYLKHLVGNPNRDVRFALTLNFGGSDDPDSINVLTELSDDCDAKVREWALSGLNTTLSCAGDPQELSNLKTVFIRRLADNSQMVRLEAIAGLAKFKDQVGLKALISELSSGDVVFLTIESATVYADPVLIPHLKKLRESLINNPESSLVEDIDIAIESCSRYCASEPKS